MIVRKGYVEACLTSLLLEREQLVDSSLRIALINYISFASTLKAIRHTEASFSASGIAASTSLVKSLSALSTSPLDMVAGSWGLSVRCRGICYLQGEVETASTSIGCERGRRGMGRRRCLVVLRLVSDVEIHTPSWGALATALR